MSVAGAHERKKYKGSLAERSNPFGRPYTIVFTCLVCGQKIKKILHRKRQKKSPPKMIAFEYLYTLFCIYILVL